MRRANAPAEVASRGRAHLIVLASPLTKLNVQQGKADGGIYILDRR